MKGQKRARDDDQNTDYVRHLIGPSFVNNSKNVDDNNLLDEYDSSQVHITQSDIGDEKGITTQKIIGLIRKQTDEQPSSKNSNYLRRQFSDLSSGQSSLGFKGGVEYTQFQSFLMHQFDEQKRNMKKDKQPGIFGKMN